MDIMTSSCIAGVCVVCCLVQVVRVGRFVGQKDEPNEPSGRHDEEAVGSTFHGGDSNSAHGCEDSASSIG